MLSSGLYIGPVEVWRRFMAGFAVTEEQFLDDGSKWTLRSMPAWHMNRMGQMLAGTSV